MQPIEIIVIIASILFVTLVFGKAIYNKVNHKDTSCSIHKKSISFEEIKKELDKEFNR